MTLPSTPRLSRERPWPGLGSFREEDAAFFFGRGREADELAKLVFRSEVTVLYSRSGLGKTSLLRAGLFPQFRSGDLLPVWIRLNHNAEAPPLAEQVKEALTKALDQAGLEASRPVRAIPGDPRPQTLWEYFHQRNLEFWGRGNRLITVVLVLDQFEEVFTLGHRAESRARTEQFLHELEWWLEHRPPRGVRERLEANPTAVQEFDLGAHACKVVIALREDFLADLETLRAVLPVLGENRYRLLPMTQEQALEAVSKGGGGLVTPAVAQAVVEFVSTARRSSRPATIAPGAAGGVVDPALLSVFCTELNARRIQAAQERISAELLVGSQQEIIRGFYERAFEGLDPRVRELIEDRLLTTSGFRNRVALEDALEAPGVTAEAVETLVDRRVLHHQPAGNVDWLELTHDLLTEPALASRQQRASRQQLEAERERVRLAEAEQRRAEAEQRRAEAGWRRAQAERARAERHRNLALLALGGMVAVSVALAVLSTKLATSKHREAEARLKAVSSLEYQAGELQQSFRALGRLDLLTALNRRTLDLTAGATEPAWLNLRARLLTQQGEIELARGDSYLALQSLTNSLDLRRPLLGSSAARPEWQLDYASDLGKAARVLSLRGDYSNALAYALQGLRQVRSVPGPGAGLKVTADLWGVLADIQLDRGNLGAAFEASTNCLHYRLALDRTSTNRLWSQRQIASALHRLGDLHLRSDFTRAWSNYLQAFGLRRTLATQAPHDMDLQEELADSFQSLSLASASRGRVAEAVTNCLHGLSLRQRLSALEPQNARWRQLVADSHRSLGDLYAQTNNFRAALESYASATNIYVPLVASDPENTENQWRLAVAYGGLGNVLRATGQMDRARDCYLRADALRVGLANRDPDNADWLRGRAVSLGQLGYWHFVQSQWDPALNCQQLSLGLRERLVARDASVATWQYDLCVSYAALAATRTKKGDLSQALALLTNAVATAERLVRHTPDHYSGRLKLAETQLRLASLLRRQHPNDPAVAADCRSRIEQARQIAGFLRAQQFVSSSLSQLELDLRREEATPARRGE